MTIPTRASARIVIDDFGQVGDAQAFARFNLDWLEEYFYVEEEDKRILGDPQNTILKPGGAIAMARLDGKPVGTCALINIDGEAYEIAKMGVDKDHRNQGIGKLLLAYLLEKAETMDARKILICTSSKLIQAIRMYRNAGFTDSNDPRHHRYDRADVRLERNF